MKISGTSGEIKNAREWGRMDTRMRVAESLFVAHLKLSEHYQWAILQQRKFLKKEIYASKEAYAKERRWTSYQRVDISFLY